MAASARGADHWLSPEIVLKLANRIELEKSD